MPRTSPTAPRPSRSDAGRRGLGLGRAVLGVWCLGLAVGPAGADVVPPPAPEIVLFEAARVRPAPFPDGPEPDWFRDGDAYRAPGYKARRAPEPERHGPMPIETALATILLNAGPRPGESPVSLPASPDEGMMRVFRVAKFGGLLAPDDAAASFRPERDADRAERAHLMARFRQLPSPGAPAAFAVFGLAMGRRRRA